MGQKIETYASRECFGVDSLSSVRVAAESPFHKQIPIVLKNKIVSKVAGFLL